MTAPVSSANSSGMADLIQFLSSPTSPFASSGLSSSQVQSVLQNASPSDIVQLSDQAIQFQEVGALFGSADTSASSTGDSLYTLLANASAGTVPQNSQSVPDATTSPLAATNQSTLQAETLQALFGTGAANAVSANPLNLLA